MAWEKFSGDNEEKMAFFTAERLAKPLRQTLHFLNAAPVLRFLEALTGIEGLLPDPFFFGGGLHRIERGGFLEVHADFNRHPKLNIYRRINLLLYLNKNWDEDNGGSLELWNEDMSQCVHRVVPIFNRCVIFNTTSTSYHGNPQPVAGPEGTHRKSLATYYYTAMDPETTARPAHSTLFQQRPGADGETSIAPTAPAASGPGGLRRAIRRWFRRS